MYRVLFQFEEESQHGKVTTVEPELDMTVESFKVILDYIYTGRISLNNENIQDILQASDLLLMTDLKVSFIFYFLFF